MTDHRHRGGGPQYTGPGQVIPPALTFELLNTPFGKDVEQTIESPDEYVDRN